MFLENVFVRGDFLSTVKKRIIENKPAFRVAQGKANSSWDFRDIENLRLSIHLVNTFVYWKVSLEKKMNSKFY